MTLGNSDVIIRAPSTNFKMDRAKQKAVIEFLFKEGCLAKEIADRLRNVYGDTALSIGSVRHWIRLIKCGRTSFESDPRGRPPVTGITQKNIEIVHKLVKKNRKITLAEIEERTGFSHSSIARILKEHLHMKKVCCRWLPKKLTQAMKDTHVEMCDALLSKYNANPTDFDNRIVTCDETWVFQHDPESKRQSMEWKHLSSPPPVKFRVSRTTKKLIATFSGIARE